MLKQKEFDIEIKSITDEGNGVIEGYASTWIRRPDAYGDIVKQGAFTKSLQKLHDEGKTIPLVWSHQLDSLSSYIGTAVADEDEKGLHFVATFEDSDEAQKVRQMYKDGRLSKFSFAYNVLDEGPVTLENGIKANELRELEIYEISCVLVPANDDASVIDVKSSKLTKQKMNDAIKILEDIIQELKDGDDKVDSEKDSDDNAEGTKSAEDLAKLNEKKSQLLSFIETIENTK